MTPGLPTMASTRSFRSLSYKIRAQRLWGETQHLSISGMAVRRSRWGGEGTHNEMGGGRGAGGEKCNICLVQAIPLLARVSTQSITHIILKCYLRENATLEKISIFSKVEKMLSLLSLIVEKAEGVGGGEDACIRIRTMARTGEWSVIPAPETWLGEECVHVCVAVSLCGERERARDRASTRGRERKRERERERKRRWSGSRGVIRSWLVVILNATLPMRLASVRPVPAHAVRRHLIVFRGGGSRLRWEEMTCPSAWMREQSRG